MFNYVSSFLVYLRTFFNDLYIVIHRLFRCITTQLCGQKRETLQAGIETPRTLRQTYNILLNKLAWEFNAYVLNFVCLHFTLSDTGGLNSLEELCITLEVTVNSFGKVLNPRRWSIYIVIPRQTVSLHQNSSVWVDMRDASTLSIKLLQNDLLGLEQK